MLKAKIAATAESSNGSSSKWKLVSGVLFGVLMVQTLIQQQWSIQQKMTFMKVRDDDNTSAVQSHEQQTTRNSTRLGAPPVWNTSTDVNNRNTSSSSSACDHSDRIPLRRDALVHYTTENEHDPNFYIPPATPTLTNEYLDRIIIVPEYQLYFCYLEKVGCAMFNNIFRLLRLYTISQLMQAGITTAAMPHEPEATYQAAQMWFRNTPGHYNLTKADLEAILIDPSWTKAVFYREPTARFLSAVVNKCIIDDENANFVFCRRVFGDQVSLQRAIELLAKRNWKPDAHFVPQGKLCGGLANTISYYDYIQPLERETATQDFATLLTHIGVSRNIQEKLLPLVATGGMHNLTYRQEIYQLFNGKVQLRGNIPPKHNNKYNDTAEAANTDDATERRYTSLRQVELVQRYYLEDYETFHLPINQCSWRRDPRPGQSVPPPQ